MDTSDAALHERVERAVHLVREALQHPSPQHATMLTGVARSLREVPASVHSEGQLLALSGVCRYFQADDQDLTQALPAAQLLARRALTLGRPGERLSALLTMGQVHAELDNELESIEAFALAREVARERGLASMEVAALAMASQTLRAAGDPVGAEALARLALQIAEAAEGVDDLRASCWLSIAQWHLTADEPELALQAVHEARQALAAQSNRACAAGLSASADSLEVILRVALDRVADIDATVARLHEHARRSGTLGGALAHSVAVAAIDIARGGRGGRARLLLALEKARVAPRLLPDVLLAAAVACDAVGEGTQAQRFRAELAALFEARRTTAQLQASLARGPMVGLGALGKGFDADAYERRLGAALARLTTGREGVARLALPQPSGEANDAEPKTSSWSARSLARARCTHQGAPLKQNENGVWPRSCQ